MKIRLVAALLLSLSCALSAQIPDRASDALFARSDLAAARKYAEAELAASPQNSRALFVLMETAALQGDQSTELRSALTLAAPSKANAGMAEIAAWRIRELAGEYGEFSSRKDQVRRLANSRSAVSPLLRLALVDYASTDAEMEQLEQSRESGLITNWHLMGPFGKHPLVDFGKSWPPEKASFRDRRGTRANEELEFSSGQFTMPESQRRDGVYYATSQVYLHSECDWNLWLESAGTMEVFVDGKSELLRDDRTHWQAETIHKAVHLARGAHTVTVKFVREASPFRVAIMPPGGGVRKRYNTPQLHSTPESMYVSAALHYWRGDLPQAAIELQSLLAKHPSAAAHYLMAAVWQRSSASSPEASTELRLALRQAPGASAARTMLAARELRQGHMNEAAELMRDIDSSDLSALLVRAELDERSGDVAAAAGRYRVIAEKTSDCTALRSALQFFSSIADFAQSQSIEARHPGCFLPRVSQESADTQNAQFSAFYRPFRRDALAALRESAKRDFRDQSTVLALKDKVVHFLQDGSREVYIHRVTRVLDRDGVVQHGEVSVPEGAEILELRTLKTDGSSLEPELHAEKSTISMPGLEPGDAIDEEYLMHPDTPGVEFSFGSFAEPVLRSRFSIISDSDAHPVTFNDAPPAKTSVVNEHKVLTWERDDIAQIVRAPGTNSVQLASVRVGDPDETELRAQAEETALEAAKPGVRVALAGVQEHNKSVDATLRDIYSFVQKNIRSDEGTFASGDVASAEESLQYGEGSRTAAYVAIARAAGIPTDVILAVSTSEPRTADNYRKQLVVAHAGGEIIAQPENDRAAFGTVPADVDYSSALSLTGGRAPSWTNPVLQSRKGERGTAVAELNSDRDRKVAGARAERPRTSASEAH